MKKSTISRQLAEFVAGTDGDQIPETIRIRAMHHILDVVGIALASGKYDFAHRTLTATQGLGGVGKVPIIGLPAALPPRDAAVVNGLLCHGLDFDDTHISGIIHLTTSAFPAAFSTAIHCNASGKDLLTAYILGVEVAARLAAVAKGGFHQVGFHPTGTVNVFSSALIAGKIAGLPLRELEHAQGIALSFASGSLEFIEDGAWTKRLHPGWAASGGINAAFLAQQGFIGASSPYEGRYGFFNAYLGPLAKNCDYALATENLGFVWELLNTAIKPFPACHLAHGCIDAALIVAQKGVVPEKVTKIRALVPEEAVGSVCEPESSKKRPTSSYAAQFSIPYLVAAAIARQQFTLAELEQEALRNPVILDLADKVQYEIDPNSSFPKAYSGEVIASLSDGHEIGHRETINRGAADRPLTNAEIVDKFRKNAAMAVSSKTAQQIEEVILHCDEFDSALEIGNTLTQPQG